MFGNRAHFAIFYINTFRNTAAGRPSRHLDAIRYELNVLGTDTFELDVSCFNVLPKPTTDRHILFCETVTVSFTHDANDYDRSAEKPWTTLTVADKVITV